VWRRPSKRTRSRGAGPRAARTESARLPRCGKPQRGSSGSTQCNYLLPPLLEVRFTGRRASRRHAQCPAGRSRCRRPCLCASRVAALRSLPQASTRQSPLCWAASCWQAPSNSPSTRLQRSSRTGGRGGQA
jgi:hypothetical protein